MIRLLKAFPYDNSYDYVKMFATKQEQTNYFNLIDSIDINDENYVKQHESFIVDESFDYLVDYGANYILFNNGYKDIFAFITQKEYVNDEATRIIFEVDVLQTYMFDFTLNESFVERKVCNVNEITEFDEGLNLGEHVVDEVIHIFDKGTKYFAMFNGIKEQSLVFNDSNKLINVLDLPFATSKPLTFIDGVQYPLYFMPLQETYQASTLTEINGGSSTVDSVILSARKLLGLPYVWGGNYPPLGTDSGTDCSGLCMWAFNDAGLAEQVGLGGRWTTYTMIEHATYIDGVSNAKVGDVLFSNFSSPGVPEHVALISGINGTDLTIIEALNESYPIMEHGTTFNSSTMEIRRMY
jgi:hypothetical protein